MDTRNDSDKARILELAAVSAPATDGSNADFEYEFAKRAVQISAALRDGSLADRVLSATRIIGKVTGIDYEDSSMRIVVRFVARDREGKESEETIRTDRLDGPNSEHIREMFAPDLIVGKTCVIYKLNEKIHKGQERSVRICPWISVLD